MGASLRFLFGGGWWTPWYALHWLMLLPIWGFYAYFRDFKPGAGPQGGEAIMLFMFLYAMVVLGIGVVNALVVLVAGSGPWWQRFVLLPLLLFCVPVVAFFLGFAMVDAVSDPDFTEAGWWNIAVTLPVLVLLCYAVNFWALATVRDGRAAPLAAAGPALGG